LFRGSRGKIFVTAVVKAVSLSVNCWLKKFPLQKVRKKGIVPKSFWLAVMEPLEAHEE